MEIIPEVGKKQRNSDLPEGLVNTLPTFSQNHIKIQFLQNTTLNILTSISEHSSRNSGTYLLPSVRAYRRPSLSQVMLGRGNPLGALQGITTRAPALTSTSEGSPWNSLSRTEIDTLFNFVWMFLRTNSLIWSLSLRNYRCENKHLMGYWKQTTPGMIREKEIFNDLSNICEEGEQRYSAAWIIPLCLNFVFLEVWKECELCIYQQTLTLKASPA